MKYVDIKEFREAGYLQEINRRFLHPLGLALAVAVDEDGTERLAGVWDSRDDPEGIVFSDTPDRGKAETVAAEYERHREARLRLMGDVIQPLDWALPASDRGSMSSSGEGR